MNDHPISHRPSNNRFLVIFTLHDYEDDEPVVNHPECCSFVETIVVHAMSRECAEAWGWEQSRQKSEEGGGLLMQIDPYQLDSMKNWRVHDVVVVDLDAAMAGMALNIADWPGN